jgi:hypothetical protein
MVSDREKTDRRRRALIGQLREAAIGGLMRGSVVERRTKCGKAACRCARDETARHAATALTVTIEGKRETVPLRQEDVERVKGLAASYELVWRLINELTKCELADLRREARERRRSRERRSS